MGAKHKENTNIMALLKSGAYVFKKDAIKPEETIKAFEEKLSLIGSMTSVYLDEDDGFNLYEIMYNALNLIRHLQTENDKLKNAYKQVAWKRDAFLEEGEHGKWITVEGFPVCSHCGSSPAYCEPKPTNEKGFPPYCHECGRIMDEK